MSTAGHQLNLLTGVDAAEIMSAVLVAAGGQLLCWHIRQVDHQPGSRTTVSYSARVRWKDGLVTDETLGAASGELPESVTRVRAGATGVGMWRFPFDPDLPALPVACDANRGRVAGPTMNLKRPWIVAGTTLAIAGFGAGVAVAGPAVQLNDRGQAPVVQLSGAEVSDRLGPADSPGSPDSAHAPW